MARRRIGQEHLEIDDNREGGCRSLYEMSALINWAEIDRHLAGIFAAAKSEHYSGFTLTVQAETAVTCCLSE